jgi:hypothetical protein
VQVSAAHLRQGALWPSGNLQQYLREVVAPLEPGDCDLPPAPTDDSLLDALQETLPDNATQDDRRMELARSELARSMPAAAPEHLASAAAGIFSEGDEADRLAEALVDAQEKVERDMGLPITFHCQVGDSDEQVLGRVRDLAMLGEAFYVGGCFGPAERYCGYRSRRDGKWVRGHSKPDPKSDPKGRCWGRVHVVGCRFGEQGAALETLCIHEVDHSSACRNIDRTSSGLGSDCANFVYVCTDEFFRQM